MEAGRIWGRGIEWDAVRGLLGAEAQTPMGRERAAGAAPLTDPGAVRSAIDVTGRARLALAQAGAPPLEAIADIRPVLERCRLAGSVLDGTELVLILPVLDCGPRLAAYGRGVEPVAPAVAALTASLPRLADLAAALREALEDDGSVRDGASPRLRAVRRDLRERRRRVVTGLERLFAGADAERILADRFVTVRHGRYVLPIRAEARGRVRGIVHDRSQSGQTVFVEPESVVEANNDLVQLAREDEQETARVLAALSGAVRERAEALAALVEGITELDWVFARAALAERMEATAPVIDERGGVLLRGALHPLLLAQRWRDPERTVVPLDLELARERPVLVVTGPNAGGKTIALKTLALHVLLAQTGCHVPAADGSRLPVFEAVHAIIGDDQSVAENLSTFSAFVKQAREILDDADDRALVLLDELGAGTDPDEGAALAQAILEALDAQGALVMATTHLEPLKAFATSSPRARNASVEFDGATLAPTFRLVYDRPGQSWALTIAARLGLAPDLIARAQGHRSAQSARMSELLAWLDAHTRDEAERTLAIERREQEAAARLTAAREAEAGAKSQAREVVARAKSDASALLADIRRAVAAEWERLKRGERSRRGLEETRRRLHDAAARVAPEPAPAFEEDASALVPGAAVSAEHLGLRGELVALSGATATVRSGTITVRVPRDALRVIGPAIGAASEAGRGAPVRRADIRVPEKTGVAPELHLLGRTTDEARDLVEQYLDDAFLAGLGSVRLVHGKGTGALRRAVRDLLAGHPLVESYRDGEASEGGTGATVALLKVG
ncbi:MAG: endonuclease MutS2 [Candidatus Rokubacteria bacterium]|nr:endonuclease MutS2 [Candidatus Rokubacteria bacterium]